MNEERICPIMSRPGSFVLCQRERCMGWVPEYRTAPTGIIRAHCKIIGIEGGI